MQKHKGLCAACRAIGSQQSAQTPLNRIGWRERIGGRTRRTDRGASAAARADVFINGDMIAIGRDGAGRAEIETARAASDLRARMGAEAFGEIKFFIIKE